MKIKDEEIQLRITPKGIYEVEKRNENIDILAILRKSSANIEPKISDYLILIYVAYITVKFVDQNKEIDLEFEDFLNFFNMEDTDTLLEINKEGVKLLYTPKN